MSFLFDKDYLEDLSPVLSELHHAGRSDVVEDIEFCKDSGSTGGEILSCIKAKLRGVLSENPSSALEQLIEDYLKKAPGY